MKTNAITTATAPALGLIAWLLLPQTAHCFYNPSTGRCPSSDPAAQSRFVGAQTAVGTKRSSHSALANAADGSPSAEYDYRPFGEVIRATGLMAKANPFRCFAKCQDDETDLLYYGYRYYNPSTGRWISRDPLDERGGCSLYAFVNNDAEDHVDWLGKFSVTYKCRSGRSYLGLGGCWYYCKISHDLTASEMAWLAINAKSFGMCAAAAAGLMNGGCFFDVDQLFTLGCRALKKCFETYTHPTPPLPSLP